MKKLLSAGVMLFIFSSFAAGLFAQQSVRGRIHPVQDGTPGTPVPGFRGSAPVARGNQARLSGRSAAGDTIIRSAVIAVDGSFEFSDVPKGEYQLSLVPTSIAAVTLNVGDTPLSEVHFGDVPARITGTVTMEGGGPIPAFRLAFAKDAATPSLIDLGPTFAADLSGGSFNVTAAGLPAGFSVRSLTAGSIDLTRQPLALRSGETTRIAVTIAASTPTAWVRVSGQVTGSFGTTPVNTIRLVGPATASPLAARVQTDGSFEFPQVLPGRYETHVFPSPISFVRTIVVGAVDVRGLTVAAAAPGDLVGEFVKIEAGQFTMGCSPGDSACEPSEIPAHRVAITRAFELGKYEVTQEQWEAVMGVNPSQVKGSDRPVDGINNWNMAQEFIERLNALGDGYRYRLPTEAEWEYAARAGTTEPHPGGLDAVGWFQSNSGGQSQPVGRKQPNAWGLYDMMGNVSEWVEDWHSLSYYAESPALDPQGPFTGSVKFPRGGAWGHIPNWTRVSHRRILPTTGQYGGLGLRLAREAR